ncbi:hypothetical protein [Loktanella sp. 3ANDIMAR09]|uniref:hypothetical protein n=1 Tax=Loktanella sp. 3ANDIMAR09 TaxID=1225657 RepID=UPI0006FC683A|nr:hypothetical protein [Loktanella sp. 3ANDIMAR09]
MASNPYANRTQVKCWNMATTLDQFSFMELAAKTRLAPGTVTKIVKGWVDEGKVDACGKGYKGRLYFRVKNEHRPPKVVRDERLKQTRTPHDLMWEAMRGLGQFTPRDVVAHATTDWLSVSEDEARDFCRLLLKGGYFKVVEKAIPGKREATYRLRRNTGPLPPRERRVTVVYDPNLNEITHMPEALA